MNGIRNRIEAIEGALGRFDTENSHARAERFGSQLIDLTDSELDRLEAITSRVIDIGSPDGCMFAPVECEHLRDVIAFVDADEERYFTAIAKAAR